MGRPKDGKARQRQRAVEDLQRSLRRRDVAGAAEHLLILPRDERTEHLPALMALFQAELDRGAGGWLSRWAVWSDAEPRLLCGLDPPRLWTLLTASLRGRDFVRAGRLLHALRPDLLQRAPGLLTWLEAWIERRGQFAAAELAELPVPAGALPERAGEPARRLVLVAPRQAAEVEPTVLRLFAQERRPVLWREHLLSLRRQAPVELGPVIAQVAVPLLLYEALRLLQEGRPVALPLLALAEMVPGAPAELAEEVFLALRLAGAGLLPAAQEAPPERPNGRPHEKPSGRSNGRPREVPTDAAAVEGVQTFFAVAGVAARYAAYRPAVGQVLVGLPVPGVARERALGLARDLLAAAPDPGLLSWALDVCVGESRTQAEDRSEGLIDDSADLEWLGGVAAVLVADGGLSRWLREADPRDRARFLAQAGATLPPAVLERLLERSVEGADGEMRRDLALVLASVLERPEVADLEALAQERGLHMETVTMSALRTLLRDRPGHMGLMGAMLELSDPYERLPRGLWPVYIDLRLRAPNGAASLGPRLRALYERYQETLVPHDLQLLRLGLGQPLGSAWRERLVRSYLSARADMNARLDVLLLLACDGDTEDLYIRVESDMMSDFREDAVALAGGLMRLLRMRALPTTMYRIALELVSANVRYAGARTEDYDAMVEFARDMVGFGRPRRGLRRVAAHECEPGGHGHLGGA